MAINNRSWICFNFRRRQGLANGPPIARLFREAPMKFILTVLGIVLLAVAGVYFLMPADQLPGFFPGHENGVTRLHVKHGIVSGVAGLVLIGASMWVEQR